MVLLTSFSFHFGVLPGGFWKDFEVMLSSKLVLEALCRLCFCRKSISSLRPTPFWKVLETFWRRFWIYFGIFCRYEFHEWFLHDFKMIFHWFWYPMDKQKWAKSMEGSAKIKLSSLLRSNAYANRFWVDYGSFWSWFWPSIGLRKRLGKQLL